MKENTKAERIIKEHGRMKKKDCEWHRLQRDNIPKRRDNHRRREDEIKREQQRKHKYKSME